jgi:hypothetical protein
MGGFELWRLTTAAGRQESAQYTAMPLRDSARYLPWAHRSQCAKSK